MILSERVVVGIILVIIGLGLLIVGYNKAQPTIAEEAFVFIEEISGQKAPVSLKPKKTESYVFMVSGLLSFIFGISLILTSRKDKLYVGGE
jgi:uncharacterized membrane protein HdeD (DUF308 family)